jgi:hypothetical protein
MYLKKLWTIPIPIVLHQPKLEGPKPVVTQALGSQQRVYAKIHQPKNTRPTA